MSTSGRCKSVWTALAATVGTAALVISAAAPAGASHLGGFRVYAPWTGGQERVVGGPGSYYGEGRHQVGRGDGGSDYWAVDINGLGGGNTDCGYLVRATGPGRVTTSENSGRGYGETIVVDHGNGVTSRYAHMKERKVLSGRVTQGQVLGTVGNTGLDGAPCHLHFEIQRYGKSAPPSAMSGFELADTKYGDDIGYKPTSDNARS